MAGEKAIHVVLIYPDELGITVLENPDKSKFG